MQVIAFNTPQDAAWRWRIVNYAGDVIAESGQGFASIQAAVALGTERLSTMDSDRIQEVNRRNRRTRDARYG